MIEPVKIILGYRPYLRKPIIQMIVLIICGGKKPRNDMPSLAQRPLKAISAAMQFCSSWRSLRPAAQQS
ncbi:hypothetical protein [Pseudomonas sp. NPDC099000]|uniref:hypothetical protein n=1 Tax=Pseudomonas sp. NPDC099000 TaxID=3364488 RepID=UPI003839D21B